MTQVVYATIVLEQLLVRSLALPLTASGRDLMGQVSLLGENKDVRIQCGVTHVIHGRKTTPAP